MARNNCPTCGASCIGEYCFRHKPRGTISRNTATRRVGTGSVRIRNVLPKEKSELDYDPEKMWAFFTSIWSRRPHYCEETGKWLGKEPKWTMFHHLLEKSGYPQYQYEEWNIMLLHPDIHEDVHQKLVNLPNVKRLTEQAWQKNVTST